MQHSEVRIFLSSETKRRSLVVSPQSHEEIAGFFYQGLALVFNKGHFLLRKFHDKKLALVFWKSKQSKAQV